MRTDKELLELLLSNLEEVMKKEKATGVCYVIYSLYRDNKIGYFEGDRLTYIIQENPTKYYEKNCWLFPPFEIAPRIEYLKQLIKKYENG